jgi:hypothetical protein
MTKRIVQAFRGLTVVAGCIASIASIVPARAQDAREVEMIRTQQFCAAGNRRECVHFGMLLQQNRDMHEAWRRNHPEFFAWERW